MTKQERREMRLSLMFCGPWIAGLSAFILFPAALSLWFSLCDYSVLAKPVFIGTANYTDLAGDGIFRQSLANTLVFSALALPLGTVVSLGIALLLNADIRGRGLLRTAFFVPSLVPLVALGMLWQYLLNPEYGLVNAALGVFGIGGPDWIGSRAWSKPALVFATTWGVGNSILIYMASLQEVPRSLVDAALVDGAGRVARLFHVTLPMISPVIYFNVLVGTIGVLQAFALPYVMMGANGEPARSTLFYAMYMFTQAFGYLRMGYASAMAWVLFLVIAVLTWTAHKAMARHVHYGGL